MKTFLQRSNLICLVVLLWAGTSQAQTVIPSATNPGLSRFLLRGYGDAGFISQEGGNTFTNARIVPVFLYKQSDKLFFEGELEFEVEDGEVAVNLEYATINYILSKNITVRAGKILVPFGVFFDRLHPSWINKLPTVPMGYGHDGLLPTSDLGIEFRSGSYLGGIKVNYSVYLTNGPQIEDGSDEADEAGLIKHRGSIDNNLNKAVGGRFGIFPFRDGSLELGFSGQTGKVGDADSGLENTNALLYAFDFTYVKNISFLKGAIDLKGQLNFINVDDYTYVVDEGGTPTPYSFDNSSKTTFLQLSYRPGMLGNPFVRNLEAVSRYSSMNTPEGSAWEAKENQWAFGLNYWLDWRTAVKFAYLINKDEMANVNDNTFIIQWAMGF